MKVGDVVMFVDEGRYKEYFYGKIGKVARSKVNQNGEQYINVLWLHPVKYYDSYTESSSFNANKFKLMIEIDEAS